MSKVSSIVTKFDVLCFWSYTSSWSIKIADNKVLIVEDDPNLLETLKYALRKEGYDVVTASDGEQAVAIPRRVKIY